MSSWRTDVHKEGCNVRLRTQLASTKRSNENSQALVDTGDAQTEKAVWKWESVGRGPTEYRAEPSAIWIFFSS